MGGGGGRGYKPPIELPTTKITSRVILVKKINKSPMTVIVYIPVIVHIPSELNCHCQETINATIMKYYNLHKL